MNSNEEKIYIVTAGRYSSYGIEGVFDSREKAQNNDTITHQQAEDLAIQANKVAIALFSEWSVEVGLDPDLLLTKEAKKMRKVLDAHTNKKVV